MRHAFTVVVAVQAVIAVVIGLPALRLPDPT
jgi:ABC-type branched-subunit amino acid transport system permease subunit